MWAQFVSYIFPQLELLDCSQDESIEFCFKELYVQDKSCITPLGVDSAQPSLSVGEAIGFIPALPKNEQTLLENESEAPNSTHFAS